MGRVVTKRQEEEVILVCERITTPLILPDNRIGKCSECGWRVQFRPHAPKGPPRMCVQCALDRFDENTSIHVTPRTMEELRDYLKKKRQ
jgi:hypothetical protein